MPPLIAERSHCTVNVGKINLGNLRKDKKFKEN